MDLENLKYPIGKFILVEGSPSDVVQECISDIERLPHQLKKAVSELSREQLDTPYRPGGWNVRQVIHHICDSHINSYIRFHWALTEDEPVIKAYDEKAWAELPDGKNAPIYLSLNLLGALHERWVYLLHKMAPTDFERLLNHPDWELPLSLGFMTQLYAWHGKHHLAHITTLMERNNWS